MRSGFQLPKKDQIRALHERRRQMRGLLWIALAVLIFSVVRAEMLPPHRIATPGWWHLW